MSASSYFGRKQCGPHSAQETKKSYYKFYFDQEYSMIIVRFGFNNSQHCQQSAVLFESIIVKIYIV